MKKLSFLFLISFLIFSCAKDEYNQEKDVHQELVSIDDIQKAVETELSKGEVFYWKDASDHFLWSAGMHSDSLFSIGYTTGLSFDAETQMHIVDLNTGNWKAAKNKLIALILEKESITRTNKNLSISDLMPYGEEEFFPQMIVQLTNKELISELIKSEFVRFVEPIGFSLEDHFAQNVPPLSKFQYISVNSPVLLVTLIFTSTPSVVDSSIMMSGSITI
jgi:hypothetical protein